MKNTPKQNQILQSSTQHYKLLKINQHTTNIRTYYKVLQSITPYYKVLHNIAKYHKVLQGTTKYYSPRTTTKKEQSIWKQCKVVENKTTQYQYVLYHYGLLTTTKHYTLLQKLLSTKKWTNYCKVQASTTKFYKTLKRSTTNYRILQKYYKGLKSATKYSKVLLGPTKYYKIVQNRKILHRTTKKNKCSKVLLRTTNATKDYKVLQGITTEHYKILQNTTTYYKKKCATKHYKISKYYKAVQLQSNRKCNTFPSYKIFLGTTKYSYVVQGTTRYYSLLLRTTKYKVPQRTPKITPYYKVLLSNTKYDKELKNIQQKTSTKNKALQSLVK